jgi:hypothetical protein
VELAEPTADPAPIESPVESPVEFVGFVGFVGFVESAELAEPDEPFVFTLPGLVPEPNPSSVAEGRSCAQCGSPIDPEDIFCGECGFVSPRLAVPRTDAPVASATSDEPAAPTPGDTSRIDIDLDPFPWGTSVAAPIVEPVASALAIDDEETRIVGRAPAGERFVLQFSTGESVTVDGTGLIGRHPVAEPGEFFDHFVTIVDPGKSVSKSHLEFGQESGAFWVSDRFSGNGTIVREPGVEPRRADAGKRYRVVRGTRIDIGEQFLVVS